MAENEGGPAEGAGAKPGLTEAQMKIQQDAKRLAREQGLEWKSLSVDQRKELKRSVRQQARQKKA